MTKAQISLISFKRKKERGGGGVRNGCNCEFLRKKDSVSQIPDIKHFFSDLEKIIFNTRILIGVKPEFPKNEGAKGNARPEKNSYCPSYKKT